MDKEGKGGGKTKLWSRRAPFHISPSPPPPPPPLDPLQMVVVIGQCTHTQVASQTQVQIAILV